MSKVTLMGESWGAYRLPPTVPRSVDRFVILDEIGQGTIGHVFRAYDPRLQREVAIKVLRVDDGGVEGPVRLISEAQAMARISHPNIVTVYDVESIAEGQVIVVMELAGGVSLAQWLHVAVRAKKKIVELFVQAGLGIAAAHEAGLLHRSFSPSNVMIDRDARVAKVTDFGFAKIFDRWTEPSDMIEESDRSEVMDPSVRRGIHALRYMAPECHRGEASSGATDQYAFCVAMWEALCGQPPFMEESIEGLLAEKLKGPPVWPSSRTPRRIIRVIGRGLAPKPEDRWPSMSALLLSLRYRTRRRWIIAVGSLVGVLVFVCLWSWSMAEQKRCSGAVPRLAGVWDIDQRLAVQEAAASLNTNYADVAWGAISTGLDQYASEWSTMYTATCHATSVLEVQSSAVMDLRMICLEHARLALAETTRVLKDADPEIIRHAREMVDDLPPLQNCSRSEVLRNKDYQVPLGYEAVVDRVRRLLARARAERQVGRYDNARREIEQAQQILSAIDYASLHAELSLEHAIIFERLGEYAQGEVVAQEALALASAAQRADLMQKVATTLMLIVGVRIGDSERGLNYAEMALGLAGNDDRLAADAHSRRAAILDIMGHKEQAEELFRIALNMKREVLADDHIEVAAARGHLGNVLGARGKYPEAQREHRMAIAVYEEVLGTDHPKVATARDNLAIVLAAGAQYEEAEHEYRRALQLRIKGLGPSHPDVATSHNNLGILLKTQGRHAEAEAEHRRAIQIYQITLGPDHLRSVNSRANLANTMRAQGLFEEAEVEHREVLALRLARLGSDHPQTGHSHNDIGNVLFEQGQYSPAEAQYRKALRIYERILGANHSEVAATKNNLASALYAQGKHEDATVLYREVIERRKQLYGAQHPSVGEAMSNLGRVLDAQGKVEQAEHEHRGALERLIGALGRHHPRVATARRSLGATLQARGRMNDAIREYRSALVIRERHLGFDHPHTVALRKDLAKARRGRRHSQ